MKVDCVLVKTLWQPGADWYLLLQSPANEESNLIAKRHVRVPREAEDDQDGAESAPEPADDLSNIDDQDRNKRFLPFGGGVEGHASGGSGNFLFDIIRVSNDVKVPAFSL